MAREKRQQATAALKESIIARIDALADAERRSKSNVIEVLLEEALDARDRKAGGK